MQELSSEENKRATAAHPTLEKCLEVFDKYKRAARQPQIDCLKHLEQEWDNATIHLIRGPVGVGKSLILRAIQEVTEGGIVTSSNVLVDQYAESFPDLNIVKGRKHYPCMLGDSCDVTVTETKRCCGGCPYTESRSNLELDMLSVFNPITYFNILTKSSFQPFSVLLIDEAHTLPEFLRSIDSRNIKPEYLPIGKLDISTPEKAIEILVGSLEKIQRLIAMKKEKEILDGLADDNEAVEYLSRVIKRLRFNPDNYMIAPGLQGKGIQLISKYVPSFQIDKMLASDKIVMASGTLFPTLVQELFGRNIPSKTYQCSNPIPAKNRTIMSLPVAPTMDKDTPPAVYVRTINELVRSRPKDRGIIHMSYSLASRLEGLDERVLRHDKDSKTMVKNLFLSAPEPLWLLASGMAEGLDLTEDRARVNVIAKLSYPYLGDPYVAWRLKQPGGQLWYSLQTLTHLMQAVGRTTRSPTDESITYVLDPGLGRLFDKIKQLVKPSELQNYLPTDFMESVRF